MASGTKSTPTRATPTRAAAAAASAAMSSSTPRAAAAAAGLPTTKNKTKKKSMATASTNNNKKATIGKPPVAPKKKSNNKSKKAAAKVKEEVATAAAAAIRGKKNYTEEEDLFLCRAYVSVSTDPTVGTNQKGEDFWNKVALKVSDLKNTESEVQIVGCHRTGESIMNRWQRQIMKAVNKWNKYYKEHKDVNPSGWNEEKFIEAANDSFLQFEGHPFKWAHCIPTLHQLPRMNPLMAHNEEEDESLGRSHQPKQRAC